MFLVTSQNSLFGVACRIVENQMKDAVVEGLKLGRVHSQQIHEIRRIDLQRKIDSQETFLGLGDWKVVSMGCQNRKVFWGGILFGKLED
jgi:hypothetical protein